MPSRKHRCYTYLSDAEWDQVAKKAAVVGKSVSSFLKDLALGHQSNNIIPQDQFGALMGLKGDLRRLGNLLKSAAFSGNQPATKELMARIDGLVGNLRNILDGRDD